MLYKSKYRIESNRLNEWNYSIPWWYYVTICTKNFKCWFGEIRNGKVILNDIGKIVEEEWLKTKEIRVKCRFRLLRYYAKSFSRNSNYQRCRDVPSGRLKVK